MKHLFRGGRRKVAAVMAVALVASLSHVAPAAAARGDDILILIGEKDSGWCAQDSPGLDQIIAKNAVAETLTIMNEKGKIVPYLAKTVENSADYKTWKITLREGIYFHDGEELTAATVLANLAANLGLNPLIPGSLPAIAWQDNFGGVTSLAQFAAKAQAVSKYVVQFNLPAPRPLFNEGWFANGRPVIWSTKTLQTKACGTTVGAGTGPFKIKSKGVDQFTTLLEANTNYWRKDADGKRLPKAATVTFKVVQDPAQRRNALTKGQADISTFGAAAGPQLNEMRKNKDLVIFAGERSTTWSFHMNTTAPPFNSKNARLAFSYAIDREALAKVVAKGNADPAYCFGASYHPYNLSQGGTKKCVTSNLAKAKEYVAAYKAETGKTLEVLLPINETAESAKANQAVCNMLKKAGAGCALMPPVTSTALILRGFALRQQVSWFNVVAGYSPAFADLFSRKTNLELSGFRFTNPGLAACFQTALETGAVAKYRECAAVLHGEAYWIPTYTEGGFVVARKAVTGLGETPLPAGGKRPVVSLSGFDFASVKVSD